MFRSGLLLLLILAAGMSLSPLVCADDSHSWKSTFIGGARFGGKTTYTASVVGSSSTSTGSDQTGSTAVAFGGEISYQPGFLGAALLVTGTRYTYQDGLPSDGELGVLFMPRLAAHLGILELWAGVAGGMMWTNLPETSGVSSGVTINITNNPLQGFAWSPRVGFDIAVAPRAFIGVEVDYVSTSPTAEATAVTGGSTFHVNEALSRHWVSGALRIGSFF